MTTKPPQIRCSPTGPRRSARRRSSAIRPEHFAPAFEQALAAHRAEIAAIAADAAEPNFDNTVAALERSGRLLTRVCNVFYVLAGAHTNEAIQAIERDMAPKLARHWNEIHLNEALFARLDALHKRAASLGLTAEQARVLERYHALFRRAGAGLDAAAKQRLKEIGERLASLGTAFGQNVLADEQSYVMPLAEGDLAGLPDFAAAAARGAAEERGLKGQHAVTLQPLQRRAVPAVLGPARTAREGVPRLDRARRQRRQDRQQPDDRRADRAARRAGAPARLSELRALQARRHDGEDAGGRDRPARRRLGAGAPPRGRGARRPAGAWWRPKAATSRSRRGTGATTPRSCARRATISTRARSSRTCRSSSIIEAAFYTANRLFGLTFTAAQRRAGLSSRTCASGR